MPTPSPRAGATLPSSWPTVAGTVILLTVLVSVLLTAFAWPSVRSHVHDVPIAVAGPPTAVKQVSTALDQRLPGGFTITEVADTAAAERLIRDREAYGAMDVSSGTPQVITASAAGAAVAQTLQGVAAGLGQAQGAGKTLPVRDLVALPAGDPRGAGLAAGALPLVMGGLLSALLLTRRVHGTARRIAGALAFAISGGFAVAAILQFWLGSPAGSYLANTGAIALAIAATSLSVIGLESLLGYAGFGLGAVTMMLVGNPLSGTSTAPEMLPGWTGTLGRLLPPGAGGQMLRSTAFFDGHGSTHSVLVLMTWLGFGVALCLAGGPPERKRRRAAVPDASIENALAQPRSWNLG
ncbi:ABC transporter permease [Streptomyces sp. NPDC059533]|uniref:ABC transporter permease n=1 Tax=unclassified Streptomyces TaxID=2593676 RepID=UPI0036BC3E58